MCTDEKIRDVLLTLFAPPYPISTPPSLPQGLSSSIFRYRPEGKQGSIVYHHAYNPPYSIYTNQFINHYV